MTLFKHFTDFSLENNLKVHQNALVAFFDNMSKIGGVWFRNRSCTGLKINDLWSARGSPDFHITDFGFTKMTAYRRLWCMDTRCLCKALRPYQRVHLNIFVKGMKFNFQNFQGSKVWSLGLFHSEYNE